MLLKVTLGVVVALILALQVIPVERTNPPVGEHVTAPDSVMNVLRRSCFDCHSNETQWPWYAYIAPVSWFVTGHVNHARQHLNFSTWDVYDAEERRETFEEIWEVVEKAEMPLTSYLRLHGDARLSERDVAVIKTWTSSALEAMEPSPPASEGLVP